jgi:hypothetical protein
MPLRDHFRPPMANVGPWEEFHFMWPARMVIHLRSMLPDGYYAGPHAHMGSHVAIDAGACEENVLSSGGYTADDDSGSVATAAWATPLPSVAVEVELPDYDEYAVRIYDERYDRQLVAAIEIVSPHNKDRPESRSDFVAKCAALVRKCVAVSIVDLVTNEHFNLYADLMELLGHDDPTLGDDPPSIYVGTCRWGRKGKRTLLQAWPQTLTVGQPLPVVPLWLDEDRVLPFDLEVSYEQASDDLDVQKKLRTRAAAQAKG